MDQPTSVTELFNVEPDQYRGRIETLWEAVTALKDGIVTEVEAGRITPVQGVGLTSCITGQLFGYKEFHGEASPADLAAALLSR